MLRLLHTFFLTLLCSAPASALNLGMLMRLSSTNSSGGVVSLGDSWLTVTASALWAVNLFNDRPTTNALTPNLTAAGLAGCPGLTLDLVNQTRAVPSLSDTQSVPRVAIDRYLEGAYRPEDVTCSFPDQAWDAVLGPARSACSAPIALLGGLQNKMSVSYWSTSPDLESQTQYPYFGRTIAQDDFTIQALMSYLVQHSFTRVGLLYINDAWGSGYATSLTREFSNRSMELVSQSFNENDGDSIATAVGQLATQKVKIVVSLNFDADFGTIVDAASATNILGSAEFQWIWGTTQLWSSLSSAQAVAVDGSVEVNAQGSDASRASYAAFLSGWTGLVPADYNHNLPSSHQIDAGFYTRTVDAINDVAAYAFDAVAAIGLAACAGHPATDSPTLFAALKALTFESITGTVAFTATGSRTFESSNFYLWNIRLSSRRAARRAAALESVVVQQYDHSSFQFVSGCGSCGGRTLQFWGGTAVAPSAMWPEDSDDDDQTIAIAVGCSLGGVATLLAAGFVWYRCRTAQQMAAMEQQLRDFEDALVGVVKMEQAHMVGGAGSAVGSGGTRWYWQETESQMAGHPADTVLMPCWVRYEPRVERILEQALQDGKETAPAGRAYTVNLAGMSVGSPDTVADAAQTRIETGFARGVRRIRDAVAVDVGIAPAPPDLANEPMLMVDQGALVQISKRHPDGEWVFASVLHAERELAACDNDHVSTDSGWLPGSLTADPTREELRVLVDQMGGGGLNPPPTWEETGADPGLAVMLEVTDAAERQAVVDAFNQTMNRHTRKIHSVKRVQNLAMFQSYMVKRQSMMSRGDMNENDLEQPMLFHGCDDATVPKIIQQGFNRSFCGKNATYYGKGVYFARDASYSCNKTYARPDSNGIQHIFVVSVLCGWSCQGVRDALVPAVRTGNILYDTTVDNPDNPGMWVTYHDAQAYPRYLLAVERND